MELKKYQQNTIDKLKEFLEVLKKEKPEFAFMHATKKPYAEQFGSEVPFVCIKIPTGGGKTLVGCHSVVEIMGSFLTEKMERGIVMWFVPSEAIKSQTLKKFKDRKDHHRKVLDEAFDNKVKLFSNEEALRISKEDVENNLCIIISSLDAFRKEKSLQNKYKVYQENGALMNHFSNIEESKVLEKDENGTVINSLANVIKLSNPLMVIDEGHKTKTKLSIEFLKDLNPSFVIEYTATPREGSNILVEVHSSELKEEQMVKLPLVLQSHTQWQNAVSQGIVQRKELEDLAKKEKGERIRPIALFQAVQEKEDDTKNDNKITVGDIKKFLIEKKIPEEEIAIKTSKTNDLEGVDLFARDCKIRYIITVNALAEGWDCSFAYVLVSVANIGSSVAVEQIIGRIMRLPNAKRKSNEDLNRSYVFASARNFNEAASQIISGLESNGYSKLDLVDSSELKPKYAFEVERNFDKDFGVPKIALEDEELTFEELIGEKFELAKQDAEFDFKVLYDSDGKAILDVDTKDKWIRGAQQILTITYNDKNCSEKELIQWLDKKLRFTMLDKDDKVAFLEKVIKHLLTKHANKFTLQDISVNRYTLQSQLEEKINKTLADYSKEQFDECLKQGKIKAKTFETFPETITLLSESNEEFNKNYYKKIDKLNKEELNFIRRVDLDSLPNIEFWIRNMEKKDRFFYLQGWQRNKFYPDFIALTKKGNILVLEWKGEDRISNEDTAYKVEIAKIWENLGKGKLHFFLIHNGNIEETLLRVKPL